MCRNRYVEGKAYKANVWLYKSNDAVRPPTWMEGTLVQHGGDLTATLTQHGEKLNTYL